MRPNWAHLHAPRDRYAAPGHSGVHPHCHDYHHVGVLRGAAAVALLVEDPDAPRGTVVHWMVWWIHPRLTSIAPNVPHATSVYAREGRREDERVLSIVQGRNTADGAVGYGPACPSAGPPHRYFFRLWRLKKDAAPPKRVDLGSDPLQFARWIERFAEEESAPFYLTAKRPSG